LIEVGLTVSRTSLNRFFVRHGIKRKGLATRPNSDPPPLNWSSAMFRKTEDTHGKQATKTGRDCHEVTAG
jgi:hypothetical protein